MTTSSGSVGYTDPTRLQTVTLEIVREGIPGSGFFNYSLDDVTTAPTAIPEPMSLLLIVAGLLGWRRDASAQSVSVFEGLVTSDGSPS
jgi:hypothetical protein